MHLWLLILYSCCILHCTSFEEKDLPWTYRCANDLCQRSEYIPGQVNEPKRSLAVCQLTCSPHRTLLPHPSQLPTILSKDTYKFCIGTINFKIKKGQTSRADISFLDEQLNQFKQKWYQYGKCNLKQGHATINITVDLKQKFTYSERLSYDTDESYRLQINAGDGIIRLNIEAANKFGSRHGFTTLNQLIVYDPIFKCLTTLTEVDISDKPLFPHRAVMLDTSRNFFSIKSIETLLDAMSLFKMNTFHWHLSDSHSFPYNSPSVPEMAHYGAYSQEFTYSEEDIMNLTNYALNRGIRIIPEIDMPAHTGFGFQWGEQAGLGKLVLCEGQSPWEHYCLQPPCGGDEVLFPCWNETSEITSYLHDNGFDLSSESYHKLWGNFTVQSYETLKRAFRKSTVGSNPNTPDPLAIFWTSTLTTEAYINYFDPSTSIIMYWENLASGLFTKDILSKGIRMILSNHDRSYMDCGFPHYVTDQNIWCSPYKNWETVYENDYKLDLAEQGLSQYEHLILGGQVLLWTEVADDKNFLLKYLPRMMASAERWWSYPTVKVNDEIRNRLGYVHMHFSDNNGHKFRPDLITTEWCVQNPKSGDEVLFPCWNKTLEITSYLHDNGFDLSSESYHKLWGNFTVQSYETLKRAFRKSTVGSNLNTPDPLAIFWTSTLTTEAVKHIAVISISFITTELAYIVSVASFDSPFKQDPILHVVGLPFQVGLPFWFFFSNTNLGFAFFGFPLNIFEYS
ncbi:hypothetical protein GJ496_010458 [Pomphorhynchus laevis]|nr:hypothetical protein GJ496_010458 [Pomphorhynchus laevis]